ncbi:hypothetical protein HELRODRAFT_171574 [Helobdella robusta]|uniref:Uncharacterized protein n=1 Tax=Helobdella robusta TaxID=6412 RepID=T1F4E9_HELRO|nr:hypothetical protein HELRODRAFT_171574 [Helobdella robusta]ESO05221.1 hypothetical protein HELRODRAFT_171574 [Helobdella robusta]
MKYVVSNECLEVEVGEKQKPTKRKASEPTVDCKKTKIRGEANTFLKRVYVMGDGTSGQLGLGSDVIFSRELKNVEDLNDFNVLEAVGGGMHTVVRTSCGKILTFGCNDQGVLGRETTDELDWFIPQPVTSIQQHHVTLVTSGDSHVAVATSDGLLFVWGNFRLENGNCHLFFDNPGSTSPIPCHVPDAVTSISSGCNHLLGPVSVGSSGGFKNAAWLSVNFSQYFHFLRSSLG